MHNSTQAQNNIRMMQTEMHAGTSDNSHQINIIIPKAYTHL